MKKIRLLCLCLASLSLVGCFHVPDEDWLPSKNNVNTWDTQKNEEMEQALNSFMDWINIISSEWNELKNEETTSEGVKEVENESINEEEAIDDEIANEEDDNEIIEENIPSEE